MKSGVGHDARALSPLPRTVASRAHSLGYVVRYANGRAIAYLNPTEALQAKMLTKDGARRIAVNIARLPELLSGPTAAARPRRRCRWRS
jgi:hypothetical protein